jgi:Glycosyl hydrolases family 16
MISPDTPLLKPWMDPSLGNKKDPYARIAYITTYAVIVLGICASSFMAYRGIKSVPFLKGNLCLVLDEDFVGADESIFGQNGKFFQEVDMGGFGNGEFEMTTSSANNSFIKNNALYILPTLTSDVIGQGAVLNGSIFNLTDCTYNITQSTAYTSSSCTDLTPCQIGNTTAQNVTIDWDAYYQACSGVSNSTTGTIINPIQSARLTTRYSASIRYGKVEIVAKMPTGDWLWPALWLLPTQNVYGSWPLSGEIDIVESRGNGPLYPRQGSNYVRGSLNWGPLPLLNAVSKTFGFWSERWTAYNLGYHTYTLEWDAEFMRISVDSRLNHMLNVAFNVPFFQRGDFPTVVDNYNGSGAVAVANPWVNGSMAAPFDQSFYLIMDVSVGGTNGWFADNVGGKPWLDGSPTAMRDFAMNQDKWYPTWPQGDSIDDRAMIM